MTTLPFINFEWFRCCNSSRGHNSPRMTLDVYGHVSKEADYRPVSIVENVIY